MPFLSGPVVVLVAALFLAALSWPLVMWLAYRRLAGIERALWAIRSELDAPRVARVREAQRGLDAFAEEKPGAPRRVSGSMFGR